jgi:hypothetical protein
MWVELEKYRLRYAPSKGGETRADPADINTDQSSMDFQFSFYSQTQSQNNSSKNPCLLYLSLAK